MIDASSTLTSWFMVVSTISLLLTASVYIRVKNLGALNVVWFFIGWLGAELAWLHLLWESLAVVLLLSTSSISHLADRLALGLTLLCMCLQVRMHLQAHASGRLFKSLLDNASIMELTASSRSGALLNPVLSRDWLRPFHMRRPGVEKISNLSYGKHQRNILDIYRPCKPCSTPLPVLLQVHGGAWVIGEKEQQGLPLMHHLAGQGWICVAINYRLGPKNRMPDHIEDVKQAIAWIKQNINDYGGNPEFIAITGGSAGGHLAALAALTPNVKKLHPRLELGDLEVQACIPFYGIYDFQDRNNDRGKMSMQNFLAKNVMPAGLQESDELWELTSPISHVNASAPPMLVIHGTHDGLAFVEEARSFVKALDGQTRQLLVYAQLPVTQHAFEVFHSVRTEHTLIAVQRFLEHCYAKHQEKQ